MFSLEGFPKLAVMPQFYNGKICGLVVTRSHHSVKFPEAINEFSFTEITRHSKNTALYGSRTAGDYLKWHINLDLGQIDSLRVVLETELKLYLPYLKYSHKDLFNQETNEFLGTFEQYCEICCNIDNYRHDYTALEIYGLHNIHDMYQREEAQKNACSKLFNHIEAMLPFVPCEIFTNSNVSRLLEHSKDNICVVNNYDLILNYGLHRICYCPAYGRIMDVNVMNRFFTGSGQFETKTRKLVKTKVIIEIE